jgi:signal peptidase I
MKWNKKDEAFAKRGQPQSTSWGGTVLQLFWVVFFVLIIRSSIIEPFRIPSGSMLPTLLIGDKIFVTKFNYSIRLPFTDLFFEKPINLIEIKSPERGDVIVFLDPKVAGKFMIKRVIGIPGDKVEFRSRRLYLNDAPVPLSSRPFDAGDKLDPATDLGEHPLGHHGFHVFDETLEKGPKKETMQHRIMTYQVAYSPEHYGPVRVPEERLFVLGDNRDSSMDSRYWGMVRFDQVRGKALVIYFSNRSDVLDILSKFKMGPADIRYNRFGRLID